MRSQTGGSPTTNRPVVESTVRSTLDSRWLGKSSLPSFQNQNGVTSQQADDMMSVHHESDLQNCASMKSKLFVIGTLERKPGMEAKPKLIQVKYHDACDSLAVLLPDGVRVDNIPAECNAVAIIGKQQHSNIRQITAELVLFEQNSAVKDLNKALHSASESSSFQSFDIKGLKPFAPKQQTSFDSDFLKPRAGADAAANNSTSTSESYNPSKRVNHTMGREVDSKVVVEEEDAPDLDEYFGF